MKKIINGKRYDTETATVVGSWDNGCYGNDFNSCSETLYLKKTGEHFLHGEGGPLSRYATVSADGNNRGWGESIILMSREEAREWAEERLDADTYEEWFEVEEEPESDIVQRLKAIRGDMSQRQAAEIYHIPLTTWECWEQGKRTPPIYVVELMEETKKLRG